MLSIIMPVYNQQDNIKNIINYIMSCGDDEIELIVVNDGSTDSTHEIIKGMLEDKRLRYFRKENGGVSSARNRGLVESKGDAIIFVDSDDSISEDLLTNIQSLNRNKKHFYFFGTKHITNGNIETFKTNYHEFDISSILDKVMINETLNAVWGKLYDGDLLRENNVTFDDRLEIAEDLLFNLEYLRLCEKITTVNLGYYEYFIGIEGSLTNSRSKSRFESLFNFHRIVFSELDEYYPLKLEEPLSFVLLKNKTSYLKYLFSSGEIINSKEILSVLKYNPYGKTLTPTLLWKVINFVHSTNSIRLNKFMHKAINLLI